jgi:flagellar hook-length control protein FliK
VPQVASDPIIHAPSQSLPRMARPAQQPDRAPSPFESLLDDSNADPPALPAPDNKAGAADSAQASANSAKGSNDCKPLPASDDAPAAKPDHADTALTPGDDGKTVREDKAGVKAEAATAVGETIKANEKGEKPADVSEPDEPAIAMPADSIQTANTIAVLGLAASPAPPTDQVPKPDAFKQPDQAPELAAIVADGTINLKGLVPPGPKVAAGKQGDAGNKVEAETQIDTGVSTSDATGDLQPAAKVTPQSHMDKPQITSGDGDKDRVTQARGEGASDSHRGVDTPSSFSSGPAGAAANVSADASASSTVVAEPVRPTPAVSAPVATVAQLPVQPAAIPLAGLAVEIAGKAIAGKNRFEIRLDPPELGRIEVRLDVDRDGNVTSRLTVDRADTFDLLRRDAAGLERALQDAGLKTAGNGLQFSLRDQSMSQQQTTGGANTAQILVQDEMLPPADAIPQNYGRLAGQGGGLDIRV